MAAEGEIEDHFNIDGCGLADPGIAALRSGPAGALSGATAGALSGATAGARLPVLGKPPTARLSRRAVGAMPAARAGRAGDLRQAAVHPAQPGASANGRAVAPYLRCTPDLLAALISSGAAAQLR